MHEQLKPYPAYKDSGVSWLGQVPEHWNLWRTKNLLRERSEKGFPNEPLLAATQTKGVVRKEQYENRTVLALKDLHLLKLVHVGDFVISLRSFQGGIEYARERGIISPAYTILYPSTPTNHAYLAWLFKSKSYVENLSLYVTGIRQGQNIDYEKLRRLELPVPLGNEQFAIVRFLDHMDRRIQRYIRAKKKMIALLNEQKQAVIHRAVTRGLDPDVRMKPSGAQGLEDIPEHWEVRRVKTLCSSIIDCKNRTPAAFDNGEYTVVRTTCVRDRQFNMTGSYQTDRKNFTIWTARGAPRVGDVFFTREAPAGEACLVPDRQDLCMGQRMMYFRPNPEFLDARYLLLNIYSPLTRKYIELATNGSTVGHLRLSQVFALPVLWCPVEEQQKIVEYVESKTNKLDQMRSLAMQEITLLQEYRTRLIADVVTGKLDVREAAAALPDEIEEEPIDDIPTDGTEEDDEAEMAEAGEEMEL